MAHIAASFDSISEVNMVKLHFEEMSVYLCYYCLFCVCQSTKVLHFHDSRITQ